MADVIFMVPDGEGHREFATVPLDLLGGAVPRMSEDVLINEGEYAEAGLPHGQWFVDDVQWWIDQFSFEHRGEVRHGAKTVVRVYLSDL